MSKKRTDFEMIALRAAAQAGLPNDLETALRRHLREVADDQSICTWVNNENRMMILINNADGTQSEFVVVGENALPWPIKPPAQRVGVEGFEDFKSTGGFR